MKKIIKYWLPVFIWAGFIFWLSQQSYLKSTLPNGFDFALRKTAHFTEYAILFLLLIRAFKNTLVSFQVAFKKNVTLAAVLSVLYALSDEYHQSFILGRHGVLSDVIIDSVGVLVGLILFLYLKQLGETGKKW